MALETGNYPADLVVTNPDGADPRTTADDHIRLLKKAVKNGFAGFTGGVLCTGTDGGSANTYTVTPTNALPSYTSRLSVIFSPAATNTGAATINVSGLGAKDIKRIDGTALVAGDLASGSIYVAIYTGTEFRLMAPTKNYIDQLSLGTAYPATASDAGKFLKYTGSAYAWAYAGIATINSTVTTDATLSGSYIYVPVAMTAMGKSVTLPAATTLSTGGPQYVIKNDGGYPFGIRDNAGTLVSAVAAGGIAYVTLKDNSTAAGSWSVIGDNLEPGLITIDNTFSSTYTSTVVAPFVALDSNTSIHFARISAGFAAFIVDNSGKVVTTPVTVSTDSGDFPVQAFKISATQAIVFHYGSGGSGSGATVLTVSGSSPSLSLSVGSRTSSASIPSSWSPENFSGAPRIAQLSSSLYLASFTSGTNTSVVAVSVSGSTITFGSIANIITSSTVADSTTTYALTATTALVIYLSGTSPYQLNAVVVSVSGTTCTVGTPATSANAQNSATPPSSCLLSSTKALVAVDAVWVRAITVSGTSVSIGANVVVEGGVSNDLVTYTASSATRYNPHLFPLSSSTALLWYLDSSSISRAVVLSESGGTVTAGAKLYGSISANSSSGAGYGVVLAQGTGDFLTLMQSNVGSSGPYRFAFVPHKISGTTITQGVTRSAVDEFSGEVSAGSYYGARLSSGDYVAICNNTNYANALPVLRANGDFIQRRGGVQLPPMKVNTSAVPAVASNRVVLLGSVLATTVGASTYQLRLLNIEVCA